MTLELALRNKSGNLSAEYLRVSLFVGSLREVFWVFRVAPPPLSGERLKAVIFFVEKEQLFMSLGGLRKVFLVV